MTRDSDSALAACESVEEFARTASVLGIALTAEQLAAAARPDPLGIALYGDAPANAAEWPGPRWRPAHVSLGGAIAVDWVHVGQRAPCGFLNQAALRAIADRPFNRLFRRRMTLQDFMAGARATAAPKGFVFHMSRTGSTLTARMLGALPFTLTISELQPVNDALFVAHSAAGLAPEQRIALLRAILAAYACEEQALIVHFDAWHAILLPLIRAAFPGVPFVFLHRDPVEVLVSYARLGGGAFPARAMPQFWEASPDPLETVARALGRICASAAANLGDSAIAVDYRDLPAAAVTKILPHFGIDADADTRARMMRVAEQDAKSGRSFASDAAAKQREASEGLRRLAAEYMRFR
jgi:hypothetical protein